jgi:hypothetical protein
MEINEFAAQLFAFADRLHQLHLKTKSYSQHKALGVYEDVRDFADTFIETWIGYDQPFDFATIHVEDKGYDPIGVIEDFCDNVLHVAKAELAEDMPEYGPFVNMIEDLSAKLYQTKYKLKNLN